MSRKNDRSDFESNSAESWGLSEPTPTPKRDITNEDCGMGGLTILSLFGTMRREKFGRFWAIDLWGAKINFVPFMVSSAVMSGLQNLVGSWQQGEESVHHQD